MWDRMDAIAAPAFINAIRTARRVQIVWVQGMRVKISCYVAYCDFWICLTNWSLICCSRMNRMVKTLFVVVALILVLCEAQVNFSPNWGKRSGVQDGPCKASTEPLMYIYKLIQVTEISQSSKTNYSGSYLIIINFSLFRQYLHCLSNNG